jgi:hypothetical protein
VGFVSFLSRRVGFTMQLRIRGLIHSGIYLSCVLLLIITVIGDW